jgi:spore germination protein GerM
MRRFLLAGALILGLTFFSGCQLRAQEHPVPVAEPTSEVSGSPTAESPRTQSVTVYLIRGERLVAIVRNVEPTSDRLTSALHALVRGVDATERSQELRSSVPLDTVTPAWRAESDWLWVELPITFDGLDTRDQVLAVAQVVYTVTENGDTDRVAFIRNDTAVDVPDAAGRLLARPVTRADYGRFAPR